MNMTGFVDPLRDLAHILCVRVRVCVAVFKVVSVVLGSPVVHMRLWVDSGTQASVLAPTTSATEGDKVLNAWRCPSVCGPDKLPLVNRPF